MSELIYAVKEGKLEKVARILQKYQVLTSKEQMDLLNVTDGHGHTALGWAVKNNDLPLVDILLRSGANPALGIKLGDAHVDETCLDLAVVSKNPALVKQLLSFGANPYQGKFRADDYMMGFFSMPLHKAAQEHSYEMIAVLLEASVLAVAHDASRLKRKIDINNNLSQAQKDSIKNQIDKVTEYIFKPEQAILKQPTEFIAFMHQAKSNPMHYDKLHQCVTGALAVTHDQDVVNQLRAISGKLLHDKYVGSGHSDVKSLMAACLHWSKITNPEKLTTDDCLLIAEAMHKAKQDELLTICFSTLDFFQREMLMLLYLHNVAAILPTQVVATQESAQLAKYLLPEQVVSVQDSSQNLDLKKYQALLGTKIQELNSAIKQLKDMGWEDLNVSVNEFLNFLIKHEKFNAASSEYQLLQKLAGLKRDCECEKDLVKRTEKMHEFSAFVNDSLIICKDRLHGTGLLKQFFSSSVDKQFLEILTKIHNGIVSIHKKMDVSAAMNAAR